MDIENLLSFLRSGKDRRTLTDGLIAEYAEKALDRYYLKSSRDELESLKARRDELRARITAEAEEQVRAEAAALDLFGRLDGRKECVMICRYLLGMKWEEIADRLYFTREHALHLHRAAIEELEALQDLQKLTFKT